MIIYYLFNYYIFIPFYYLIIHFGFILHIYFRAFSPWVDMEKELRERGLVRLHLVVEGLGQAEHGGLAAEELEGGLCHRQ